MKVYFLFFLSFLMSLLMTACSSVLYYPSKELFFDPTQSGIKPEVLWFTHLETNEKVHAWRFAQTEKNRSTPRGLIVFFHGNGENLSSHYRALFWILPQGYDFIIFDYRGYGLSDGKPSPQNTLEDGKLVLNWAKKEADQLKIPLIIFGQSLGGAVALRSVIELKSSWSPELVVVDSTFHSYKKVGQKVLASVWITWPFQWLAHLFLSDRYAPGGRIAEIAPTPLVVIHGDQDLSVRYELGKKVFELAHEPKEFWHVEGGRHIDGFWRRDGKIRELFLSKLKTISVSP